MKKNIYLILTVLLGLVFVKTSYLVAESVNSPNSVEQYSIEQSKSVKFDKKRYNELVKRILRTKSSSFLHSAASKTLKEICYLMASLVTGVVAAEKFGKSPNSKIPVGLFAGVLTHTTMRLLFDYMLASKDENLQNLENFEKYIHQALSSNDDLVKEQTALILKLFEKDYGLIANKLDHDRGAGFLRKLIRWCFEKSIFSLESVAFGVAVWQYSLSQNDALVGLGIGSVAGIAYFIFLILLFDGLLAGSDPYLLKIEKLRDIDQFFEEIKIKVLELQHEHVALAS